MKASLNRAQSRGSSQTAPKTPCTVAPLIFPVRYVYEVSVYLGIWWLPPTESPSVMSRDQMNSRSGPLRSEQPWGKRISVVLVRLGQISLFLPLRVALLTVIRISYKPHNHTASWISKPLCELVYEDILLLLLQTGMFYVLLIIFVLIFDVPWPIFPLMSSAHCGSRQFTDSVCKCFALFSNSVY